MADAASTPSQPRDVARPGAPLRIAGLSRHLITLATAMLLGVCFLVYYLTYVQQNREYLLNRNYRVLSTLGEQMSDSLANQVTTLRSYVASFENKQFASSVRIATVIRGSGKRHGETIDYGQIQNAGPLQDEISALAPRLRFITIGKVAPPKTPPVVEHLLERRNGEWVFHLSAVDTDGDHEARAILSLQDLAQSFSASMMDTFDDVLVAGKDDDIIFQRQRIGPQFSTLTELLKNESQASKKGGEGKKSTPEAGGRTNGTPEHLVEVDLAGVPYEVFLEPVTVDLSPQSDAKPVETVQLTLAGLVPASRFRWQSFAVPYRGIIFFSSVFLLLWLSTPVIKIFFFNERERLRLREIVLLPVIFMTITSILTSICLQTIYFNFRHDDTDLQLEHLSNEMTRNMKTEIQAMWEQLMRACDSELLKDLSFPDVAIRTNVLNSLPEPKPYPYFSNLFWTNQKGWQLVKWFAGDSYTPPIDVSRLEFFRNLDSDRHYFFLDEKKPFRLDSLLPPNQDNYVAVLGMKTRDCNPQSSEFRKQTGYAFLTAKPLSLIDPTLPLGFGFALVDDTGRVLFHSDKYRNNRENFLLETSNDRELRASLYGHSNSQNFSLAYRGDEIRARVVPVDGVHNAPWSLIVYRDARYERTYDLEIITTSGTLLLGYLAFPAFIAGVFYFFIRPKYMPDWLWPSENAVEIYILQIAAGLLMLALSTILVFLTDIEQSLYTASATGYATLIIVTWGSLGLHVSKSDFNGKPRKLREFVLKAWVSQGWPVRCFVVISLLSLALLFVIPSSQGWWWSVVIGPLLLIALIWRGPVGMRWKPDFRHAFVVRALVLMTVIGILPAVSFFRNSMLLENHLSVRASQLHAAAAWNARERMIEKLDDDVPGLSNMPLVGFAGEAYTQQLYTRCEAPSDFYLSSSFCTTVERTSHAKSSSSDENGWFHTWFLNAAHSIHHSYNDIAAEALGVMKNPSLPEAVYVNQSSGSPEWEWLSPEAPAHCQKCPGIPAAPAAPDKNQPVCVDQLRKHGARRSWQLVQLRMHQGVQTANPCATPAQQDLLVSSVLPGNPISLPAFFLTWGLVLAIMGTLFRLVTQKICLFELCEPLDQTPAQVWETLRRDRRILLLATSRDDWSAVPGPTLATLDIRGLAIEPACGERFDVSSLRTVGPIVLENFDWELCDPTLNAQRIVLLEKLLATEREIILVSTVDPFPYLVDGCGAQVNSGRWGALLAEFTRVNLRRESTPTEDEVATHLPWVWEECKAQPELRHIAEDLLRVPKAKVPMSREQTVTEVQERASEYYYGIWRSCTHEECFLLVRLAEDGLVNPKNTASLRQLLRRKLIVKNPQFQIMNESFRRFVHAQSTNTMRDSWDAEAASSGWGRARGAFSTVLVLVGIFLLATQQQFLHTAMGLLTAGAGGVAAVLKLIGTVQGRTTGD